MSKRNPSDLRTLRSWSFLTGHGHVLVAVARKPAATVAELAAAAEITERSTYRILADLQQAGYVQRRKVGRHNEYEINPGLPLRDPTVKSESVRNLLRLGADAEVEGHGGVIALPRLKGREGSWRLFGVAAVPPSRRTQPQGR